MVLTQTALRGILAQIFSVDEKYIIPKQGTWYNPQDSDQLSTFVAFLIRSSDPTALQYFYTGSDTDGGPISIVQKKGVLELQIVGKDAETTADSVSHWIYRTDVSALFGAINAQLMADKFGSYNVSNFIQDGPNSVLAYNVNCPIQFTSWIQAVQGPITSADIGGDVIIP